MGIGINRVAVRERVPLPSMARETWDEWIGEFAKHVANGTRNGRINRFVVLDNMVVETKEIVVHRFNVSDAEDPDLYAAEPLWQWQNSDQGKWVMERSMETPIWHRQMDPGQYHYTYAISATFDTKTLTEYYLRFGNSSKKP